MISVSWKEFQKIDGGVWTGHPLTRHKCAVQFDDSAHRTLNALGSRRSVICKHLCATKISFVIWCVTCLIHGCSVLPHYENTQYVPHISKITQSTSCAIKNHSGVKTCRVAETRALQLPQGGVPFGVGGHDVELVLHWNEGTHVRAPDVVVEADAASPERGGSDKGVGMPHRNE